MENDNETKSKVIGQVVFHAKLVVQCAELAQSKKLKSKPFDLFGNSTFTVGHAFTLGGCGFALCYDIMAPSMSPDQVAVVRKALSVSSSGRVSWGMDLPSRRISSNWAGYHGDLYVMCAAIEGEEGFDRNVFDGYSDLMHKYLTFGFYESGHPVEDVSIPPRHPLVRLWYNSSRDPLLRGQ